jgi:hypothetical protein
MSATTEFVLSVPVTQARLPPPFEVFQPWSHGAVRVQRSPEILLSASSQPHVTHRSPAADGGDTKAAEDVSSGPAKKNGNGTA